MFYDQNTLIAKSNNFQFFTKLINGTFPQYSRIIPKDVKKELILPKKSKKILKQYALNLMRYMLQLLKIRQNWRLLKND